MSSNRVRNKCLDNIKKDERTILNIIASIAPIAISDIYYSKDGAYLVVNNPNELHRLLTTEAKLELQANNLRVIIPDNQVERSVFITGVRPFIYDYENEEILASLNANNNFKVERVFKLKRKNYKPGQTISVKAIMSTAADVDNIMKTGAKFLHLTIPSTSIYKEDSIQFTQCFKCFHFTHDTKDCPKQAVCSECRGHITTDSVTAPN